MTESTITYEKFSSLILTGGPTKKYTEQKLKVATFSNSFFDYALMIMKYFLP